MRTIEPARIIADIGRDQFAEHILVETVQRTCNLAALLEIEHTVELPDDGNGSAEESAFVLWIVRLDPGPGEFNRLDGAIVQQDNELNTGGRDDLGLFILTGVLSEHRWFLVLTVVAAKIVIEGSCFAPEAAAIARPAPQTDVSAFPRTDSRSPLVARCRPRSVKFHSSTRFFEA